MTELVAGVRLMDVAASIQGVEDELAEVCREVLTSGSYVGGRYVERFEAEWASYCDRNYAVGVGNGTDALQLTLQALGVARGDEVIVPTNTFIATAEAVVRSGATPVFVDVDDASLLMSAGTVSEAITSRTVAVIAVHLYGQPCDMDALAVLAERAGIALIEDAAQAHGASWAGRKVGSFGTASCFSFYPTKNLGAAGDGGAVTTDDATLAARIRSLSNHGRSATDGNQHLLAGGNSRLDALQAAVLSVKLPYLDSWTKARSALAEGYRARLQTQPQLRLVHQQPDAVSAHHLQIVRVADRDRVRTELAHLGIGTGVHYPIPCHLQPVFSDHQVRLPTAENAAKELLSLPMFPQLPEDDVAFVCEALLTVLTESPQSISSRGYKS